VAAVTTKFMNRPNRRAKVAGFTLIKILLVIAIIMEEFFTALNFVNPAEGLGSDFLMPEKLP
jgi:hypothetical protein